MSKQIFNLGVFGGILKIIKETDNITYYFSRTPLLVGFFKSRARVIHSTFFHLFRSPASFVKVK